MKRVRTKVQHGQQYGRWVVLSETQLTERGETKYLCRCACGTERFVLERSLQYGLSASCGCLRKERAAQKNEYDLGGQRFGALNVQRKSEKAHGSAAGIMWHCRCDCGRECDVSATLLVSGRKTHCGGRVHKEYTHSDISGKRFRYLTALYPTAKRTETGSVIWHCRCDCGRETDVSYNSLMWTNTQSCGCKKLENDQKLKDNLTHVAGTCVDALKSRKVPSNNSTGVKGVYLINNNYVAKIVFQKRQYQLGTFRRKEEAAQARREAENSLNETFLEFYDKWSKKAEKDPDWAEKNPISVSVQKDGGTLRLLMTPKM